MRKIVSILITALIFCSCKHDYTPPPDFNFSLSFGYFGDEISTYDSTFRTDATLGLNRWGDTAVKVVFTKEEMQQVYKKMLDYNYLDLPDTMDSKECIAPCSIYTLKVTANSKTKLIYTIGCPCKPIKDMPKFDSIMKEILYILYSKKEVKNLPPSKRIAL